MSTYTLADGRETEWDMPLARHERECIAAHLRDLRRMDSAGRRLQLDAIDRSMGRAYRDKLAKAYSDDWTKRKAQQEMSK